MPTPPVTPPVPPDSSGNGDHYEPLNIADELRDSYLSYAMSVIISRALPDVRDGLKPSQRRILVAMHDLNLGPTAATSKCAGIVGETMKRYHPHGDASIYPTLVRMAQDWNMRVPLIRGQGNFGSIAGLPAAAMRYCITGDTLVWTAAGIRPIAELADVRPNSDADLDLAVVNYCGQLVHVSKLFHSGSHPTYRLRTRDGFELVGTSNHPLLCLDTVRGAPGLVWRLLGRITPGTRIARLCPQLARVRAPQLVVGGESANLPEEILTAAASLRQGRYHFAEVAAVEDAGVQPVYSIRVDSDCHSFITNGFISHNTEARLSPASAEMLADLEADTVDYIDNYDGKYREPLVLPSKFPNLLVNGSFGVAVGMTTDIPPHNLGEVCDALIRVIDDPEVTLEQLLEVIPGPDFPTGGIICGRAGIREAYRTGKGKVTLRARAEIVEEGNRNQIIITEVPYRVTRNALAEDLAKLVKDERIKGIASIRDESSARGGEPVRLVIDIKQREDPHLILNQLYKYSKLQDTVSIIMLALVDSRPKPLSLKEMLEEFLRHRVQVIRRRTEYQLREAKRRTHILEGQLIAISSLDEVIRICRGSASRVVAKEQLQQLAVAAAVLERALGSEHFAALQREIGTHESYRMTEAQAEAVVRLQLGQLAALERDEILKEYNDLRQKIVGWERLLGDERNIRAVIRTDMEEMRDKYGSERVTGFSEALGEYNYEDLIAEEQNAVTISHNGYIKRLALTTYRSQHRGGKGVSGGGTREDDDFIEHFFVASTHAYLLCFTNRGQVYWLKVYNIPQGSRTAMGKHLANVLSLKAEEKITSVIPVRRFDANRYLLMATRRGVVKKTALEDYSRPKAGGIIGIKLDDGDTLIGVCLTQEGDDVVLSTRTGMAICFNQADARPMGRNTYGVKGINLQGGDEVVGMVVADPEGYLLTVCENGYGKRTPFGRRPAAGEVVETEAEETTEEPAEETAEQPEQEGEAPPQRGSMGYRRQRRGGKGLRDIRAGVGERNGLVVAVAAVRDGDDIMLITSGGMVNRTHVDEIRVTGRNTMGVRIMKPNDGDKIASIAKLAREDAPAQVETASPPAEAAAEDGAVAEGEEAPGEE